ncbi:MAG: hypothetical protein Q4C47_05875 [Planctomycetia bacterium]|nr:hypothetical protein [Planctomycetia bacterium]
MSATIAVTDLLSHHISQGESRRTTSAGETLTIGDIPGYISERDRLRQELLQRILESEKRRRASVHAGKARVYR